MSLSATAPLFNNRPAPPGRLLLPLDALRRRALRALGPLARPLMQQPELRIALGLCLNVATALLATLLCPLWLLGLSPLILGVPHLLADVRYLVVRPGFHRRALYILL